MLFCFPSHRHKPIGEKGRKAPESQRVRSTVILVQISDGLSNPQVLRDKSCCGVLSVGHSGFIPGLPPLGGVQGCAQAGITWPLASHLPAATSPPPQPRNQDGLAGDSAHLCIFVLQ